MIFCNIRPVFKVSDPKVVGVIPTPAFADFLLDDAEFETSGVGIFQMSVEGGGGNDFAIDVF